MNTAIFAKEGKKKKKNGHISNCVTITSKRQGENALRETARPERKGAVWSGVCN